MALARCQDRRQRRILPSRHAFFPLLDRTPMASASRARHALAAARQEAMLFRRQERARARRPDDPIAHSSVALSIKYAKDVAKLSPNVGDLTQGRSPPTPGNKSTPPALSLWLEDAYEQPWPSPGPDIPPPLRAGVFPSAQQRLRRSRAGISRPSDSRATRRCDRFVAGAAMAHNARPVLAQTHHTFPIHSFTVA